MSDQTKPTTVNELRATAQIMTLEPGVFCIFHQGPVSTDANGLPGVRISQAPGATQRPGGVQISTFREDGWLGGADTAALIRVNGGRPGQVLVTVYQAQNGRDAPRLQVVRLTDVPQGVPPVQPAVQPPMQPPMQPGAAEQRPAAPQGAAMLPGSAGGERAVPPRAQPSADKAEVAVHINRLGDVLAMLGEWAGERGSRRWIEGFALAPKGAIGAADIEYQAVLGRDWLSPWSEGGQYCGSRGMSLPLLGLRVRLRGAAAERFDLSLEASFVNGASVGPVAGGEPCETPDLAALEAIKLTLVPRGSAAQQAPKPGSRTPARRSAPAPSSAPKSAPPSATTSALAAKSAAKPGANPAAKPGRRAAPAVEPAAPLAPPGRRGTRGGPRQR